MHTPTSLLAALAISIASATAASSSSSPPPQFTTTTLTAPDSSMTAHFVPFGATLVGLFVRDKGGRLLDVVPGFDDNERLAGDVNHLNGCVGRYANRIKNASFSIPITKDPQPDGPNVYHTPPNDHNGADTLHGGVGWDRRNWTVVESSPTSVTYQHIDSGDEGFPGTVFVSATYTVLSGGILRMSVHATASEKTPIMVTHHDYWNLCGFVQGCDDIMGHTLQIAGSRVIEVDGDAIPTGKLLDVNGTAYDFRSERMIGEAFQTYPKFQGYDNAWVYDGKTDRVRATLYSKLSGIMLQIATDQPAVQVYTASLNMPRKQVHGGPKKQYGTRSTVAIEQEGWIDAINTPEWGVDQIYGPRRNFTWNTEYRFSVVL
ncbi:galactose mutarotase-like protein [Mycena vitilis]|nr:galactose mutarotase-like protein [Mycena vitilis]